MQNSITKSEEKNAEGLFDQRPFFFYSIFAFLILSLCAACLAISGKTWLSPGDGFLQHYPIIIWLKDTVGNFLQGNGFAFWSWPLGLGMDTIGALADVLTDPFAYIAAAFPKDMIDVGYTFSELLRLYFVGAAMFAFLRYEKMNGVRCIMGGLGYAFCSWAMISTQHAIFLNPLLLFPLVMLGVHRMDREKKPAVFIMSVAACLATNLYFAYVTGLMVAVYFVVRYFFLPGEHCAKDFFKRLGRCVVYVAVACLIAAPVVIPTLLALLQVPKGSGKDFQWFRHLKGFLVYLSSPVNGEQIQGNYATATISGVFLAFVPMVIWEWKQKRNRCAAAFFGASVFMLAFPIFGSIFNGMGYSAGRWCYMLAFFAIWSLLNSFTHENFREESNIRYLLKGDIILTAVLFFFLFIGTLCKAIPTESLYFGLFNLLFLLLTMTVLALGFVTKKRTFVKRSVALLLVCSVAFSSVIVLFPTFSNPTYTFLDRKSIAADYKKSVQRAASSLPKEGFSRTDQMEYIRPGKSHLTQMIPANEAFYYGNPSSGGYLSMFDDRWFELHKNLNCNNGYYKRVSVYNNDNRSRMDFLMGVRYFLGDNKKTKMKSSQYAGYAFDPYKEVKGVAVSESRFDTSLGYGVSAVMKKSDWLSYDPLDREQILMQAAIVPDDYVGAVPQISPEKLQLDTAELPYEITKKENLTLDGNKLTVNKKNAKLTLSLNDYENSELYVSFRNLHREKQTYEYFEERDSKKEPGFFKDLFYKLRYPPDYDDGEFAFTVKKGNIEKTQNCFLGNNQAFTDLDDYLTNLGYSKDGNGTVTIVFEQPGEYTFDALTCYTVSQENFDAQATALSEQRLKIETNKNDFISGAVNMKEDGILRLSMIHSPGWKATVDGAPTDFFETMDCGSGIFVPAGTHQIELHYTPVLWIPSLLACGFGLLVWVILLFFPTTFLYKKKKTLPEINEESERFHT
ncbi:MAG: YfhO family protein [Oscillospiraceae bacterium]